MNSTTFRRQRVMKRRRDLALQLVVEEMEDRIMLASLTASSGVVSISGAQGAIGTANVQSTLSAAAIPDPTIFIPVVHGNDGDTVSVPIELTVTAASGITVSGFQVAIAYDSSEFSVNSVAQLGPMFSAALGFSGLLSFPAPGELIYNASSGTGTGNIPFNTTAPLFTLSFTVASDAPTGPSVINLLQNISTTATAIFDNNLDELILTPAPTNAPTDSVDGLFQVGPAALVSIALSPASPSVAEGLTQQFTATGTYTDRSSAVVTNQVTWASGTTSVATISNTSGSQGLASTLATGTTAITAALSGITSPSDTLTVTAPLLTSIAVSPLSPSVAKGLAEQFTATGTYTNNTTADLTTQVTWASSTTSVATISNTTGSQGLASTLATGTTAITAALSGITSPSDTLTVTAAALVSIAVAPLNPSVAKGLTEQFTATGTYTDGSNANLTTQVDWVSGTTSVATISNTTGSQGLASTLATGTTAITAALSGITSPSDTLTVTAPPPTDFWTGASAAHGGNDDWSNAGNWSLGAPPSATETADFTASESQYSTSIVDIPFSIANLTIDSTWGGTVDANASLTISGNLTLASGTLSASGSVSVAGSNSQYTGGTLSGNVSNSGTLTIAGSGTRTFNGALTNSGTIQVSAGSGNANTITGTVYNEGLIAVASNAYLYISGNYYAAGGSITGPGYLYNTALYVTASPTAATTILLEGTGNTLETNNLANTTLWVQGNGHVGNAVLNVAGGTVNDGTILLESQDNTYADTLAIGSGTLTNAADGTIQVAQGSGGGRGISGTVVNQGQIDVGSNTGLGVSGTLENQGQVAVSSYTTISGTYEYDGGSITGPGYLYNCTLDFTVNPTAPTTLLLEGSGDTLGGADIPADATLWVQGNGYLGQDAVLNLAGDTVNDGTILLESQNNTYGDTLALAGTFTNAADGTIQVTQGSGGGRGISGTVVNQGQIEVGPNTGVGVSGTLENQGQVTVSSYTTISGIYEYDGGSITGPGYLYNCTLDFTVNPTAPTTLLLEGSGDTLGGADIPADATLWVQGNGYLGQDAVLNLAGDTVNDGTILLESQNNTYGDTLATGSGTLTNAADGTIQVTQGSGGGRGISGTVVNQGQIDVGPNTGVGVSGTLENQGQVTVSSYTTISGTYEYDGGSITGPGYLYNCTLDFTVNPTAPTTLLLEGSGDTLGGADIPADATLWVQGNGYLGQNAVLNLAGGTVNDGTILLESQNNTYGDTLALAGTFTNAADGTIQVTQGSGGGRGISGTVVNQGQIDVGPNTGVGVSGTLENQGQVAVSSYTTISGTYEYDGGSITGPGYLYNCTLDFTVNPTAPTTLLLEGSGDTLGGADIPADATLWVQGNGYLGQDAVLNLAGGTVNDGTILLESQNNTYGDTLALAGTFTNAADGTIQVTQGSGGGRGISGTVVNQGQIEVGPNTGVGVSGTLENQGQVTVSSYTTISGIYEYDGGSITGPGYLYNCTLDFTVNPTAPTTLLLEGSGDTLGGADIPADATLWVQGNGYLGQDAVLNLAGDTVNDGTILLESQNNTYGDTLATGSGTLTNAADGTIQVTQGSGGGRGISGTVVNQGQIDVGPNTGVGVSGTLENQGQVTVSSYTTISGTYEYDGGSITGPGYLYNCTLDFTVNPTAPTTLLLEGSGDTLGGADIPADATLWVQGNGYLGQDAVLNLAAGTVNDGTILLESQNNTYADTLALAGTFTNDADGAIQVAAGSGGARSITGSVINAGTIDFDTATTFGATGASLVNTGLMSIAGATVTVVGNTLTNGVGGLVSGYGTFTTSGVTVNDTSGTVQASGGTLNVTNSGLVSSGTLGVGTWLVGPASTLTISGVSSISTLSANVALQGSGATFTGLSSLSKISSGGELELENDALTTAGNLDNAGTIDLAPGTLNVAGTYTQESTGAFDVGVGGTTPGSLIWPTEREPECVAQRRPQRQPDQ